MRELSTILAQRPKIGYLKEVEGTAPHHITNPLKSSLMRKIEQQMNDAVANNKNWQSANTSVHFNEENGVSIVRLHGNKIAEIGDDYLQIFDGGWQTTTTKSRLNALIDRFCNAATDGVFQSDFQWYIRDNNVTRDFDNGYIFAWDDYTERLTLSPYSFLRYESTFQTKIFQRTSLFSHEISSRCYHRCSALE